MEKKYPIGIAPNNSKHQDIILKVCKAHGVKSLELTTKHIALMSDCISEYIAQQLPTGAVWVKATKRLPEPGYEVFIRHSNGACKAAGDVNLIQEIMDTIADDVEWLDESDGEKEADVFAFAEWATGIAFFDEDYRLWNFLEEGKMIDGRFRFSTEEFYEVYKREVKP
jgi:hypothetical protein